MLGFSRELLLTSNRAARDSKASFRVFQASLRESATTVVCATSLSKSTLGTRSSSGSPAPLALPPFPPLATSRKSACVFVDSGAACPATLSNSELMVLRSCGFRSSMNPEISALCQIGSAISGVSLDERDSPPPTKILTVTRS